MAQDHIMRLVQQIAAMLAAIITKRRNGQTDAAKEELGVICLQTIGLSLNEVNRLSPEGLARHLQDSGSNRYVRAVILAELLIQDAEIRESDEELQKALVSYLHAFCLLFDVIEVLSAEEQAIYRPKLEMLAAKLHHLPPNPFTTEKLEAYRTANPG